MEAFGNTAPITFNQEVIWDSNKPLFDIYFKEQIINKRYKFAYLDVDETLSFEESLEFFKKYGR